MIKKLKKERGQKRQLSYPSYEQKYNIQSDNISFIEHMEK